MDSPILHSGGGNMGLHDCESCSSFSTSHFCNLKQKYLDVLNKSKAHLQFKKGQTIFREGDIPQNLYCVTQGMVRLNHLDEEGNEVLLRVHKPGEALGYRALFAQEPYHATAIAQEACEICVIPESIIKELMTSDPELAMSFLKHVSKDLHNTEDRMSSVISKPVLNRVAEALIYFKVELPESKWTRKDIAEWVGTTPETVMRTLAQFESQGLIEQEGRSIRICDRNSLNQIAHSQ